MDFRLSPQRLAGFFATLVTALMAAHGVTQTARFATGNHKLHGLVPLFSVGSDGNLPTFYSAFALLFCAGLLVLVGLLERREGPSRGGYWLGLGAIFVFLSLDEMLELHEQLIGPVRGALGTSGLLFYAWVIPYAAALLVFAAIYLRFLLRLPRRTALLFVVSGAVFVTGAIGLEMLGGRHFELYGKLNVGYVALQTVEELLEMVGIVLFIYAVADYIDGRFGRLCLHIHPQTGGGSRA